MAVGGGGGGVVAAAEAEVTRGVEGWWRCRRRRCWWRSSSLIEITLLMGPKPQAASLVLPGTQEHSYDVAPRDQYVRASSPALLAKMS